MRVRNSKFAFKLVFWFRIRNPVIQQCCGSGSGILCLFDPGIWNRFFPDLESRIPNPYFGELGDNFLGTGK